MRKKKRNTSSTSSTSKCDSLTLNLKEAGSPSGKEENDRYAELISTQRNPHVKSDQVENSDGKILEFLRILENRYASENL